MGLFLLDRNAGTMVTAQTQGDYLARIFLVNLSQGIPLSFWYDWRSNGPAPRLPVQLWNDNVDVGAEAGL